MNPSSPDIIQAAPTISLRQASAADAAALAALAHRVFHDTFAAQNDPHDMALYLAASFGESLQRAEIEHPQMQTFLAEAHVGDESPRLIGYAQLHRSEPPPCVIDRSAIEIKRFYIDHHWHGRGVATRLMETTCAFAAAPAFAHAGRQTSSKSPSPESGWSAKTIWLGVWEHNPRAIAFYRKCGFTHVGAHEFLFGNDLQSDWVMVKSL